MPDADIISIIIPILEMMKLKPGKATNLNKITQQQVAEWDPEFRQPTS